MGTGCSGCGMGTGGVCGIGTGCSGCGIGTGCSGCGVHEGGWWVWHGYRMRCVAWVQDEVSGMGTG